LSYGAIIACPLSHAHYGIYYNALGIVRRLPNASKRQYGHA